MRLENKIAVVTGAGSGIGLAIAGLFVGQSAKVVAVDWHAEAIATARSIQAALGRIGTYHAGNPGTLEPIDIANAALFQASYESRHLNGAVLPVDMGWRAA